MDDRFGCSACWPASPAAALAASGSLAQDQALVDDSHLGVAIRSCPRCRQRFVAVFLEHVDWKGGDDTQYWTLMPITEAEATELVALDDALVIQRLHDLPKERRCLQNDHPTGGPDRVGWGRGILIVY